MSFFSTLAVIQSFNFNVAKNKYPKRVCKCKQKNPKWNLVASVIEKNKIKFLEAKKTKNKFKKVIMQSRIRTCRVIRIHMLCAMVNV